MSVNIGIQKGAYESLKIYLSDSFILRTKDITNSHRLPMLVENDFIKEYDTYITRIKEIMEECIRLQKNIPCSEKEKTKANRILNICKTELVKIEGKKREFKKQTVRIKSTLGKIGTIIDSGNYY